MYIHSNGIKYTMQDIGLKIKKLTYKDIVDSIDGRRIQKGMNFRVYGKSSIFLMNSSPHAAYLDKYEGGILTYEGHDIPNQN